MRKFKACLLPNPGASESLSVVQQAGDCQPRPAPLCDSETAYWRNMTHKMWQRDQLPWQAGCGLADRIRTCALIVSRERAALARKDTPVDGAQKQHVQERSR